MRYILLSILSLFAGMRVFSQSRPEPQSPTAFRIIQSINTNWQFHKGDTSAGSVINWEPVSLPHSYNTQDVLDDEPGYYRGVTWYKKAIYIPATWNNRDVYLHFEGVAQVADVYVNGKHAASHTGSYGAFNCRINDLLNASGENMLVVKVDNSHNEDIPPLSADFTFFGGIYRDVYLCAYPKVHFDVDNYASKGVFISTPKVDSGKATVTIKGIVTNNLPEKRNLLVTHKIIDADGKEISVTQKTFSVNGGLSVPFEQTFKPVEKPRLWSPETPYLYTVVSTINDAKTKALVDEITNPVAFRWFRFTGDQGFFLNGKPYKIWGVSRHQDYKNKANAVPDALQINDIRLIKEMGANFLRVAHYPQDPAILEACDRMGLLTSVEIPVVNTITETGAFSRNCEEMMKEMVRQHFNHPSVIIWAYMNEVLLRPRFENDKPRQEIYFKNVYTLAKKLDSIARKEDPFRYTMIPCHGNFGLYKRTGLTNISGVLGWNLYQGWYSPGTDGFGAYLDRHRKELPDVPVLVTEYGADAEEDLHCFTPERFDKTIEYASHYHQEYFKALKERPFVSGGLAWALADFSSEPRAEASPHINTKGLLTIDRKPKDTYLYYQSKLLKTPYIKIGPRSWNIRSGIADGANKLFCSQPLAVYTNQASPVTLLLNDKVIASVVPEEGIALFTVPFTDGHNQIEVSALTGNSRETIKDIADIRFRLIPVDLRDTRLPFTELNISLGDKRFYIDEESRQVWLPEQPYTPGSWGYTGGSIFSMKNKSRQSYGSDKNILGTDHDPVFETQRTGIKEFKLDVPRGRYEVILHFAELLSDKEREALAYNLDNSGPARQEKADRSFDILINNVPVINALSNDNYLVPETAYSFKTFITVTGDEGISIDFKPLKGESILNGLQVRKIF